MMRCLRCGTDTPRLTIAQRHCPQCAHEVEHLLRSDYERRRPRFAIPKELTGALR